MPAMVRPKGRAKKIAYKILGVPANIKNQNNAAGKKGNVRLSYEETRLVR
jgi:hypothetical protein